MSNCKFETNSSILSALLQFNHNLNAALLGSKGADVMSSLVMVLALRDSTVKVFGSGEKLSGFIEIFPFFTSFL